MGVIIIIFLMLQKNVFFFILVGPKEYFEGGAVKIYIRLLEQSRQSMQNRKIYKLYTILQNFAQKLPTSVCLKHCLYVKLLR